MQKDFSFCNRIKDLSLFIILEYCSRYKKTPTKEQFMFMEKVTLLEVMQTNLLFNPFNIPDEKIESMRLFFTKEVLQNVMEIVDIIMGDSMDSSIVSALISALVKILSVECEKKKSIDMRELVEFILNSILESDIFWVIDRALIDVSIQSCFELLEFEQKTVRKKKDSCYSVFSFFW